MRSPLLTAAAVALVGVTALAVTQNPPAFRGGTDMVPVYVTVTDARAQLVTDLTKDDFSVFDNGRKQPLATFSAAPQPFSGVMMLDRSGSMTDHFDFVRDAGIAFVNQLRSSDRLRIGSLSTQIVISPAAFTGDRDTLIDILRHGLQPSGPSPIWNAVDQSITALLDQGGRRVILIFSDGHDSPGRGMAITHLEDVVRRVRVDDVMVYAIGFPTEPTSGMVVRRGRASGSIALVPPDPGLKRLAEESGGGYFEARPDAAADLAATFSRIAEELHRQYLLAFVPPKLDGKTHKVEVRVSRPDVTVRARATYEALPPS